MRKELTYGCEAERVDFDTLCCNVLFLEFSRKVTLDESGLVQVISYCATGTVIENTRDTKRYCASPERRD